MSVKTSPVETSSRAKAPLLRRVDHLNVQVAPDKEDAAKHFYGELLGLRQIRKPDSLGPLGAHYCLSEDPWYELHLGVGREDNLQQVNEAQRRHLGFQVDDLATARRTFEAAGIEIEDTGPAISESRNFRQDRFFIRDPGGNLLEILEVRRPYNGAS